MSSAADHSSITIVTAADPQALALSVRASCLVFEDPASQSLLDRVQRIAPSDATALIIGESGTARN
jgi:sigma-54-specific transcriptional regulator